MHIDSLSEGQNPGYDCAIPEDSAAAHVLLKTGVRSWLLTMYEIGRWNYVTGLDPIGRRTGSAVRWANEFGIFLWYGDMHPGRKKKTMIDIKALAQRWHKLIVGLAMAHDKDEADLYEAAVEDCLSPILTAPVKQLREFAALIRDSLKTDRTVPYLIWRGLEVWINKIVLLAPDEDYVEMKTTLATEIVAMVEDDAKRDLPAAMIRALQWRSPQKLEEVKAVVTEEKAAGRTVRLKGRESCLFLEAGGSDEDPKVCVQV